VPDRRDDDPPANDDVDGNQMGEPDDDVRAAFAVHEDAPQEEHETFWHRITHPFENLRDDD